MLRDAAVQERQLRQSSAGVQPELVRSRFPHLVVYGATDFNHILRYPGDRGDAAGRHHGRSGGLMAVL